MFNPRNTKSDSVFRLSTTIAVHLEQIVTGIPVNCSISASEWKTLDRRRNRRPQHSGRPSREHRAQGRRSENTAGRRGISVGVIHKSRRNGWLRNNATGTMNTVRVESGDRRNVNRRRRESKWTQVLEVKLEATDQGIRLPVKAVAGARRSKIVGAQDGALKVCVTQVAEKGKANQAIIAMISKELGLRKSQIQLVSGHTSPRKVFLIGRITRDELAERIDELES